MGAPQPGGSYVANISDFTPNNPTELKDAVNMWTDPATKDAALNLYGPINEWDVSLITDMSDLFNPYPTWPPATPDRPKTFNDDISNWDVSNVTNMERMFFDQEIFNQNIGSWNVSNVTNMKLSLIHI